MTNHMHASELHAEINSWKNMIEFVRVEVKTFEKQLGEVAMKNTDHGILAHVQHFESMFIRQREVNDELFHDLKIADHHLAELTRDNPAALHVRVEDFSILRDNVTTYEKLFVELRNEYHHFLQKAM